MRRPVGISSLQAGEDVNTAIQYCPFVMAEMTFLAAQALRSRWVSGVCTGSFNMRLSPSKHWIFLAYWYSSGTRTRV